MNRNIILFLLPLLCCCCNGMQMKEIKWDWWKKQDKTAEVEDVSGDLVPPDGRVPRNGQPSDPGLQPTPILPPGSNKPEKPQQISRQALQRHIDAVWLKVLVLRDRHDLDAISRTRIEAETKRDMATWYAPMGIQPPDPGSPDWDAVIVWDFMPEESFRQKSETWSKIALSKGVAVPDPLTRRKMMPLIRAVMGKED